MALKFYKELSTGKWRLGNGYYPAGTVATMQTDISVSFSAPVGIRIPEDEYRYTEIMKEDGSAYGTRAAFDDATKDFFSKASTSGGGDDANWLVYKALLTQFSGEAPIAHVLNRDASNFLDGVTYERIGDGRFVCHGNFPIDVTTIQIGGPMRMDGFKPFIHIDGDYDFTRTENSFTFYTYPDLDASSDCADLCLINTPIEIRVRRRGVPPQLLSAVVNEYGDNLILTFDKKMMDDPVTLHRIIGINATLFLNRVDVGGVSGDLVSVEDNKIIISLDSTITSSDTCVLINDSTLIESFDYGLLQPIPSFYVTNNSTQQP